MKLRSVELVLPNARVAAAFMTDIWGLAAAGVQGSTHYLRGSGVFPYLISFEEGQEPFVRTTTFVCSAQELEVLGKRVASSGLASTPTAANDPGGGAGLIVELPEGELFRFLASAQESPPIAGRDLPVQLTHVVLNSIDAEATARTAETVLGFRVSDRTRGMVFVRCNDSHHSTAFARSGFSSLNHIAFEMQNIDAVMRGIGRLRDRGLANATLAGLPAGKTYALADVVLLPVIPNPTKILCVGHNYESHRQETGRAKTDYPSIFTRFADTLVAHGQPIVRPRVSKNLDFEGELAIIVGRGGRAIAEASALEHIAGYACFNDASVRDWQWHTGQFTPGKNFPGTGALGPWLITPEEAGDLTAVRVTTRLNGDVVQDQPIGEMLFSIAQIIAYVSAFTPLSPGDVIATGTPGGVGAKRSPPLWMKAGDKVEVDIGPVGRLSNRIIDED